MWPVIGIVFGLGFVLSFGVIAAGFALWSRLRLMVVEEPRGSEGLIW